MDTNALRDKLIRLASNYYWSWSIPARELLESLPGAAADKHPMATVVALTDDHLAELLADNDFVARLIVESEVLDRMVPATEPTIAYCSPAFT